MFSKISISSSQFLRRLTLSVCFCIAMLSMQKGLDAQETVGYATPVNPYTFVYPLEKIYTTTLFRSEKFEKLGENADGYIISLKLDGKQSFVLLPFQNGERKIAEQKHKGVGVNYTAYLTFARAYLPFYKDTYYKVLKTKNGLLTIDYQFKGFRKIIEVPASKFNLKTTFEYELDEVLELARKDYSAFDLAEEDPEDWDKARKVKPHTSQFKSTHLGVVENADIGINLESSRWISPSEILAPVKEFQIKDHTLTLYPIVFTWEVDSVSYHFVRTNENDRPALIKEFKIPNGEEGFHKFVKVELKTGESVRLLEITKNVSIEIIEDTTFFVPGTLVAVAKVENSLPVHTKQGVYRGYNNAFKLYTPKEFLNSWTQRTEKNTLTPDQPLFKKFLAFPFPPALTFEDGEWADLREIQQMAIHYSAFFDANRKSDFKAMFKQLDRLEKSANLIKISINSKPEYSRYPHRIRNYQAYWKRCTYQVFAMAAGKKKFDVIKFQLLKFKVLLQEISNPSMIAFISKQIATYEIYMPVPLNKVSQVNVAEALSKTDIMTMGQRIDSALKIDPLSGASIKLTLPSGHENEKLLINDLFNPNFLLDSKQSLSWYNETNEHAHLVLTEKFWENKLAREAEIALKLDEVRKEAQELQEAIEKEKLASFVPESAWVAIAAWAVILLVVNCAFFVLLRGIPNSSPTPQTS